MSGKAPLFLACGWNAGILPTCVRSGVNRLWLNKEWLSGFALTPAGCLRSIRAERQCREEWGRLPQMNGVCETTITGHNPG